MSVKGPDGRIVLELSAAAGTLTYQVMAEGQPVLRPSRLGIKADDVELSESVFAVISLPLSSLRVPATVRSVPKVIDPSTDPLIGALTVRLS